MDHIWFVSPPPASILQQHPAGSAVPLQDPTGHLSIPRGMQPMLPVSRYEKAFWPAAADAFEYLSPWQKNTKKGQPRKVPDECHVRLNEDPSWVW